MEIYRRTSAAAAASFIAFSSLVGGPMRSSVHRSAPLSFSDQALMLPPEFPLDSDTRRIVAKKAIKAIPRVIFLAKRGAESLPGRNLTIDALEHLKALLTDMQLILKAKTPNMERLHQVMLLAM